MVVQQHERGPRRRRAAGRVVDRVPAERRHDPLGREVLGQVLGRRGPEEEQRLVDPAAAAGRPGAEPRQRPEVAGPDPGRVRRCGVEEGRDQLGDPAELGLELRQRPGVGRREIPNLALGPGEVVVEVEGRAVGEEVERRPGRVDLDAALNQPQVAPDRLAQHAQDVGAGRGAVPGRELLGHAAAADDLAPFADNHPQAGGRKVVGGDEAVVAAADDHGVVVAALRAHDSSWRIFASRYATTAKIADASSISRLTAAPALRSPVSRTRSLTTCPSM